MSDIPRLQQSPARVNSITVRQVNVNDQDKIFVKGKSAECVSINSVPDEFLIGLNHFKMLYMLITIEEDLTFNYSFQLFRFREYIYFS